MEIQTTKTHVLVTLLAIFAVTVIGISLGREKEVTPAVMLEQPVQSGYTQQVSLEPVTLIIIDVELETEEEVIVESRYGFTDDEIYILAQLLCGDEGYNGDGEYDFVWGALHDDMNYYEMSKVLCVIMNRVRNDFFPDTVCDVILQPGQFIRFDRANTNPADIAIEKITEWCEAYDRWDLGAQSIPENHYFFNGDGKINHTRENWR